MKNLSRRSILKLIFLTGITATPGCNRHIFKPSNYPNLCNDSRSIYDAHAHFFNASDLQAGGYLGGPVLNELTDYLPDELPKLKAFFEYLGKLVQKFGNNVAISASKELEYLESINIKSLFQLGLDDPIENEHKTTSSRFYEELSTFPKEKKILEDLFTQAMNETKSFDKAQGSNNFLDNKIELNLSQSWNEETLYDGFRMSNPQQLNKMGLKALNSSSMVGLIYRLIGFFSRMLTKRSINLEEYRINNTFDNSPSVTRVTDVLVDFDYWLGCTPVKSNLQDQVDLHTKLNQLTNGYVAPLIGFNPWKAIVEGDEYISFIKHTLRSPAFVGIKIYPTLGFGPDGKLIKTIARTEQLCSLVKINRKEAEKQIRQVLSKIYDFCESEGYVVMAHTNHSSGISNNALSLAGPDNWNNVLEKHPKLKVNLGHLGTLKTKANGERNWTAEFLSLISNKNYENVYGDIGYWYDRSELDGFVSLITSMREKAPIIMERIMYGSDWYMITKENGWEGYLQRTYDAFSTELISPEEREQIFFENAMKLFHGQSKVCS